MPKSILRKIIIALGLILFIATAWVVKTHIKPFNITSILSEDDPVLIKYKKHLNTYNDEADLYVLLESEQSLKQGTLLYDLVSTASETFKTVSGLESVHSLYEQQYPSILDNKFHLKPFFENKVLTTEGMRAIQNQETLKQSFLDPSFKATLIYLRLRADLSVSEMNKTLENILATNSALEKKFSGVKVHALGTEIARLYFMKEIAKSQGKILPLVIFVILSILFYLFRSWKLCSLSLFVMLVAYATTVALIVLREGTINPFCSFALLFVLIISTADLVHLFSAISATPGDNARTRVQTAIQKIYRPCFVCAATTWIGLLSLMAAGLPAVVNFGIYCAFGVAICFFLIFHFLPFLLEVFEIKLEQRPVKFNVEHLSKTNMLTKYKVPILTAFVLITLTLGFFSTTLKAGDNLYKKFVPSHPLSIAVDKFSSYFSFNGSIDVTLDANRDFFLTPKSESLMQDLHSELLRIPNVAHIKSLFYYQKMLRELKNHSDINTSDFMQTIELRGWFSLLDDNEVFSPFLPAGKDQSRIVIFTKSLESEDLLQTQKQIETVLSQKKYAEAFKGEVNGFSTIRSAIFHSIYDGFINSFLLDFLGIFICFLLFFRSFKWAVIAMIPNLLPVVAISGIMGMLDITLEYNLIVLVAIVFGIAVDDTTHFLHYLLLEYRKNGNILTAVQFALKNTSVALLGTTFIFCVTIPAFFLTDILMFSQVALILIFAMLIGVAGDMYVLPALLFFLKRKDLRLTNE